MSELPQAIFFDVGGTLIRPAQPVGATYAEVASHYGATLDAERVQREFVNAYTSMQDRAGYPVGCDGDDRGWWGEVVRRSLARESLPETFPRELFFEEAYAVFERSDVWRVYPEVEQVLAELRERGHLLYVLSNWDARLHATLRGLGLTPYFERIFASAEHGVAKPDPAYYEVAARAAGVAPHEAMMVGDDEENDYWAPRRAGWQAVIVDREKGEDLTKVL
ncbi:MAG: HAD-IA family hydrolase [Verrucomicrobiota bacterium]